MVGIISHPEMLQVERNEMLSLKMYMNTNWVKTILQNMNQNKILIINELDFNPNLQFGYRKRTELEPDLLKAQELIKWADHLVWIYPVWWGSIPAIMKGFIDRVFLPGFAFQTWLVLQIGLW